tara:strand:- start:4327 stop:4722 length:396 start_codon:yes stop_codon:yes gene_type:complete
MLSDTKLTFILIAVVASVFALINFSGLSGNAKSKSDFQTESIKHSEQAVRLRGGTVREQLNAYLASSESRNSAFHLYGYLKSCLKMTPRTVECNETIELVEKVIESDNAANSTGADTVSEITENFRNILNN